MRIRNSGDFMRISGSSTYFDLNDYHRAAEAFFEGSKKPGALIWMKTFAAKISGQGETRETSVMLWSEIYNSAANADLKGNALTHLRLLRVQSDCEQLDRIAAEYEKRTGQRPKSMRDLVNAGLLPRAAVDPLGFVYYFDAEGKTRLNPASPLSREQAKRKAL